MPTFTATAFDRLIEPGASKFMTGVKSASGPELERRNGAANTEPDKGNAISNPKSGRRNGMPTTGTVDRKHHWPQILPALYATPESTPLPDSPSSFPPSPYIINHKRRGPLLLKSFTEDDGASRKQVVVDEKAGQNVENAEKESPGPEKEANLMVSTPSPIEEKDVNVICAVDLDCGDLENGLAISSAHKHLSAQIGSVNGAAFNWEAENELEDFLDPLDSMSTKSNNEGESNVGLEQSLNLATPMAEFFDAWDELSFESGPQPSQLDVEAELREIKLSLLMEIEKRKQAEEMLDHMHYHWQRLQQHLSLVGLTLPADSTSVPQNEQPGVDPAEELFRQLYVARFASNTIGRATAKAEVEMEMEAQIESKNFEIARLWDKLHYYEAVNHEMSQRNQEAVDMARRLRQRRKRRQAWVWGSITAAVVFGTGALAWSYLSTGRGSSSTNHSIALDHQPLSK